jgi:hypothetical protein
MRAVRCGFFIGEGGIGLSDVSYREHGGDE